MTKAEIIELFAKDKTVDSICKKNAKGADWRDLRQELYLRLCLLSEQEIVARHERGELLWWIILVVKNITITNWKKYKNEVQLCGQETETPEGYDLSIDIAARKVEKEMLKLNTLDRRLFVAYVEIGSAREIGRESGVPERTIVRRIAEIRQKIKSGYEGTSGLS